MIAPGLSAGRESDCFGAPLPVVQFRERERSLVLIADGLVLPEFVLDLFRVDVARVDDPSYVDIQTLLNQNSLSDLSGVRGSSGVVRRRKALHVKSLCRVMGEFTLTRPLLGFVGEYSTRIHYEWPAICQQVM